MKRKVMMAMTIICILLIVGWFVYTFEYVSGDFRNNLWAPAYLLIHGESPYHISVLFSDSTAVWFPQIIGVFFPLGLLSQNQASNLWLIINGVTLIGMTTYLMWQVKQKKTTPIIYGLVLLAVIFFPSSITHFGLGQVDFLLIAAMLTSAYAIENHNAPATALSFAFALTKPQICFLVLPSAFISLILKRKWKSSLLIAILSVTYVILLTIPLWVFDPNWVKDFIWNLRSLPKWWQPALLSQLQVMFDRQGFVLWFLVATTCLVISIVLWNKLAPHQAVLWSLALTTLAAPYLWSWDFTLLLPLFIDTAARLTKVYARLILFFSWVMSLFFSIWSHQFDDGDKRLWWLPLVMLFGLGASLYIEYKNNPKISPTNP